MLLWPIKWAIRLLVLILLGLFVYLVITVVQVLAASQASQVPTSVAQARVIVVMGEPATASLSSDTVARLEQALSLYQAKRAPVIVIPGATGGPQAAQARLDIKYLEQQNMPRSDIAGVTGTSDSAVLSRLAKVLGGKDPKVIIVADPLDGLRLRATAASAGLTPEISPATPPSAAFLSDVGAVWHQATSVAMGRVVGF